MRTTFDCPALAETSAAKSRRHGDNNTWVSRNKRPRKGRSTHEKTVYALAGLCPGGVCPDRL
ncbi:DUF6774 domain-containing protein, partial [Dysosmobacter welbionis]